MKTLSKYAYEFFKTGYVVIIWFGILQNVNPQKTLLNTFMSITIWLDTAYTNIRISNLEETIHNLTKKDDEV